MTAETIHTCSYSCERPECIRAQRDELAARLTAETSNARGEWVLVPRWNMERVAETLERDGDEHGAAYELRDMLAAAPPPAAAEPKTLPVPTRVYLTDKAAVIVGDPQRGWDEEGPDAHNCDAMGCATIGPHVLARVPFTDERAMSQPAEAQAQSGGEVVAWRVPVLQSPFGEWLDHGVRDGLVLVMHRGTHGWKAAGQGHALLAHQIYVKNVEPLCATSHEVAVVGLSGGGWRTVWARSDDDVTHPAPPSAPAGVDAPGSRAWMAEVCRAAALSLAAHGVRNDQLSKVADWITQQPAPSAPARPKVGFVRAGDGTYYAFEKGQSEQPAAVDEGYPTPRNRAEAVALARLALAHLGVIDAHIDAAIARCETNSAAQPGGSENG